MYLGHKYKLANPMNLSICDNGCRGFRSLLDVLRVYAELFMRLGASAVELLGGELRDEHRHTVLPKDVRNRIVEFLQEMFTETERLGFHVTSASCILLMKSLDEKQTYGEIHAQFEHTLFQFSRELNKRLFLLVDDKKSVFYENHDAFSPVVCSAFPSTKDDIKAAGSCFALEQSTACVFHSMRVLEKGIRCLAGKIGLPPESNLQNWKNILDQIEAKIRLIEKQPKSEEKNAALRFYSGAATQFRYFKDAWRNHVSHSDVSYGSDEASIVFNHVKEVMTSLASGGLTEVVAPPVRGE